MVIIDIYKVVTKNHRRVEQILKNDTIGEESCDFDADKLRIKSEPRHLDGGAFAEINDDYAVDYVVAMLQLLLLVGYTHTH